MKDSYAIVETGGKQYKVHAGQRVDVDYLGAGEGNDVELSKVLLISDGDNKIIGTPMVDNARVTATCVAEGKGDKVLVFKYKPKVRYRVKKGHRQLFTRLEIKDIVSPGAKKAGKAQKQEAETGGND
jgi:large subunit ribosomal protein L21